MRSQMNLSDVDSKNAPPLRASWGQLAGSSSELEKSTIQIRCKSRVIYYQAR